jgi:hypothetical protein
LLSPDRFVWIAALIMAPAAHITRTACQIRSA